MFSKRRTDQSKRDNSFVLRAAENKKPINQRNEYNQIIEQLQDSLAGRKDTNMDSVEVVKEGS